MPCLLMLLWLASVIGVWVCVARGFRDTAGEADADRRSSARAAILLAAVPPTAVFLVTAFVLLQAAPTVQFNAGSSLAMSLWSFWVHWWQAIFGCSGLLALGERRGVGGQPLGQALALRRVEHDKSLEKRNRANGFATCLHLLALTFGGEAVGIKDGMPPLAFANASASGQRLPEGQPILTWITAFNDRPPQDQDIDARISTARYGIARKSRHGGGAAPRLRPRKATRFKLGDDFGGHFIIERRARSGIAGNTMPRPRCASALIPARALARAG